MLCETEKPSLKRGQLTIELTTSALCDLDCTYCFEGAKTNANRLDDLDKLILRIRQLKELDWYKKNYDSMNISFWGGEPTLNVNYIIRIMHEFDADADVHFHIYSNGYNRKNWQKLLENINPSKLDVQISYDGRGINDMFRLTNNGKSTADMVLNNFEWLTTAGLKSLWFKSTLPGKAIPNLYRTWLEFEELHEKYKDTENVRVAFAPTLDYTMGPNSHEDKKLGVFKEQMMMIAKKEIDFYKKYGRHLCSWFGTGDEKVTCSAGLNMVAVDVDGSTYACHGALYSPGKENMKSSTIFDESFIEDIQKFNNSFEKTVTEKNPICEQCVATMCMICPVASYEMSEETEFFSKWGDKQINGLCDFYQTFGRIDRTIQNYLRTNMEK